MAVVVTSFAPFDGHTLLSSNQIEGYLSGIKHREKNDRREK